MLLRVFQEFAAPLAEVEGALIDPAFLARLAELPKLGEPDLLSQDVDGHVVTQRVRYQFVGELNAAVRRALDPDRLTWVEVARVNRSTHVTDWRIEPDHYPNLLRATGTFTLTETGGGAEAGTRRSAEIELRVTFPLVGGSIERAIASGIEEHAALEAEAMSAWLGTTG